MGFYASAGSADIQLTWRYTSKSKRTARRKGKGSKWTGEI